MRRPRRTIYVDADQMQAMLGQQDSGVTHTVTSRQVIDKTWRERAIADLYEWMKVAQDQKKMIDLWAAVYIRCGACLRGWQQWLAENPIGDDLPGWLEAAKNVVLEKRWI